MPTEPYPPPAQPLVSVIMNCYNGQQYLREAIDSVIAQTYSNWEIVFWDNRSTDTSADIFLSYNDPRLRYYYAPIHTLLYEARNYAIEKSRGEFIAFLDVDDWWVPEKLDKQIPLFDDSEVGVVFASYWRVNGHSDPLARKVRCKQPVEGRLVDELLRHYSVGLLTLVIRRAAFQQLDHGCDPRYHIIGDFDLVIRLALGWKLACIEEPLAFYRQHSNNESARHRERAIKEMETWALEMANVPRVCSQEGFQLVLQGIHYDYGRLYVAQHRRYEAFRKWRLLPWGMFKAKLLLDILIP